MNEINSDIKHASHELEAGEISRESWADFLDDFALKYKGWIADVVWPGTDPQEFTPYGEELSDEYLEYRLEGIETDLDGGNGGISIHLSGNREIILDKPERIEILGTNEISHQLLKVDASGVTCHLHLHVPRMEQDLAADSLAPS